MSQYNSGAGGQDLWRCLLQLPLTGQGSRALASGGLRSPTSLVTCPRAAAPLGEEVFLHLRSELPNCGCCLLFHRLPLRIRVTVVQVGRDQWRSSGPTPMQGLKLDPAAKLDRVAQAPDVMEFATFALLAYIQWWIHHNLQDLFRRVCCSAKLMHGVVVWQTQDLALLLIVLIVQLKSALPNMPLFTPKPAG